MTNFAKLVAIPLVTATLALAGCGSKAHNAETTSTSSIAVPGAVGSPTPRTQSTDPSVVASEVDSTLKDVDSDLSSFDRSPADESDPSQ